jgi:ATP-dependent DNA helicase RecG
MQQEALIELIEDLIAEPKEQTWLEFKTNVAASKASVTPEGIGEYISALSNGACISNRDYAYLVLGIEDGTHAIVGTNFRPSTYKIGNQDFELWLRNLLYPKVNFEIFECTIEHKNLVLFRIPATVQEPVNFQNKPFIRINSQKTDLRNYPHYMREIYNSLEDWSAQVVPGAGLQHLDEQALQIARQKFKAKSTGEAFYDEIDIWSDPQFLDKAKITSNGQITRTALLLLGKPESIHLLTPVSGEITWKLNAEEKAYEHFGLPFLLSTTKLLHRIRNYQHKFFPLNELLAITVDKYEPRVILEALHNAIAHQNYRLNARIIVEEHADKLIFQSAGSFFRGTPEDYFFGTKTADKYRNPWLVTAMRNLGMIDTIGYGIHTMILEQKKRFFPLPDYVNSTAEHVILEIYGQEIDINYTQVLIERQNLELQIVVLLDRVQKRQPITKEAAVLLKKQSLIEGRSPNFYVSAAVAQATGQKASYTKNKAFDKAYYLDLIEKSIQQHKSINRKDVDELLWNKLPEWMDEKQKKNKITNLLSEMRHGGRIKNAGSDVSPVWIMVT